FAARAARATGEGEGDDAEAPPLVEVPPGAPAAPPAVILEADDLGAPEPESAPPGGAVVPFGPLPPPPPLPASRFTIVWSGAVDFGFFIPQGNGAGWIQDEGPSRVFPADGARYAWVFLGDIYSTAVNSRGEPADLGNPPGVTRVDSVASRGAA